MVKFKELAGTQGYISIDNDMNEVRLEDEPKVDPSNVIET